MHRKISKARAIRKKRDKRETLKLTSMGYDEKGPYKTVFTLDWCLNSDIPMPIHERSKWAFCCMSVIEKQQQIKVKPHSLRDAEKNKTLSEKIEDYRMANREELCKLEEIDGKVTSHASMFWALQCRAKLVEINATDSMKEYSRNGAEFRSLVQQGLIINVRDTVITYNLDTFRLAVINLSKRWRKVGHSQELLDYIECLEVRCGILMNINHPRAVLNFKRMTMTPTRDAEKIIVNDYFYVVTDAYFHGFRSELRSYSSIAKLDGVIGFGSFKSNKCDQQKSLFEWVELNSKGIYGEEVVNHFNEDVLRDNPLLGERDIFVFLNPTNLSPDTSELIGYFRPEELNALENSTNDTVDNLLQETCPHAYLMFRRVLDYVFNQRYACRFENYCLLNFSKEMRTNDYPLVVRICNRFGVYHMQYFTPCEDIRVAFLLWLNVIHRDFKDVLENGRAVTDLVRELLMVEERDGKAEEGVVDMSHVEANEEVVVMEF